MSRRRAPMAHPADEPWPSVAIHSVALLIAIALVLLALTAVPPEWLEAAR